MRRVGHLALLVAALLAPFGTRAQLPDKVYRLAVLSPNPGTMEPIRAVLLTQLAKQGFVEGRNLRVDARFGETAALPALARELAALTPDAIFASSNLAVDAARAATATAPIVMFGQNPVGSGYAASLARPGGQVTGVAILTAELDVKRLELLLDVVPALRRAAVLIHRTAADAEARASALRALGSKAGLALTFHRVAEPGEYAAAFAAMREGGAQALVISANTHFARDVAVLARLAGDARLPTVCEWQEMAASGCMLGYGPSRSELYRLSANYLARIFKGADPAELPIEQPTNFELGVNVRVARGFGIDLPPTLLLRADEVIE